MTDYNKQAEDFLRDTGSTLDIVRIPLLVQKEPEHWGDATHGYEYRVKLTRGGKSYTFSFWDSVHNKENGKRPSHYDVLACLDTYIDDSVSLADFMSEYGYEVKDVERAQKTLALVQEQTRKLRELYSEEELERLRDIV